jgi:5-methylcytosine-specific restriction endonuclease McrA
VNKIEAKYHLPVERCHYCGKEVVSVRQRNGVAPPKNTKTIDHKIPVARGGRDLLKNYVIACRACNEEKGTLTYEEYLVVLKYRKGIQTVVRCDLKKHLIGWVKTYSRNLYATAATILILIMARAVRLLGSTGLG